MSTEQHWPTLMDMFDFLVERQVSEEVWDKVVTWLDRDDGVAVYENHDLGSPEVGRLKFMSYGSLWAQWEDNEPPNRFPDIAGMAPGWRYVLIGYHRLSDRTTPTW